MRRHLRPAAVIAITMIWFTVGWKMFDNPDLPGSRMFGFGVLCAWFSWVFIPRPSFFQVAPKKSAEVTSDAE